MKSIGIKLADGSFYPILKEGNPEKKQINLTTVKDGQTKVQVDLYRSESGTMEDAEYVDSLEIKKLKKHPNGEPDINLDISIDENNELYAELHDPETGKDSSTTVSLVSKTIEQLKDSSDISFAELNNTTDSSNENLSFDTDEDFSLDPNSLNIDSLVEETQESSNDITLDEDFNKNSTDPDFSDDLTLNEEFSLDTPSEDLTLDDDFSIDTNSDSDKITLNNNFSTDDDVSLNNDITFKDDNSLDSQTLNEDFSTNSAGLDFSDILDEETKEGNAAGMSNTEEIRKKTKVPVLICIICAIICIIAVLLILFIIPSKFNISKKFKSQNKITQEKIATQTTPQMEQKHEAKKDDIIVAPAEEIVPEIIPQKEATKNVEYKIKWGDTLWDISQSYYNNPWKYKKIAKYNKIKNPDHIISGTKIIILAE